MFDIIAKGVRVGAYLGKGTYWSVGAYLRQYGMGTWMHDINQLLFALTKK